MKQKNSKYNNHSAKKVSDNKDKIWHGHKLAAQKRKQEIDTKRFEKAKMLREYSKLCEKEGIESERVHIGPRSTSNIEKEHDRGMADAQKSSLNFNADKVRKKHKHRPNPFEKSLLIAEKNKLQTLDKENIKKQQKNDILKAEQARNTKKKLLSVKTKKGQPIIRNQMSIILQKLQK